MLRSFVNILFFLLVVSAASRAQTKDSIMQVLDSIKQYKYVPTGIRIGADVIGPVKSKFQDDFSGWEFSADIDFNRYYLVTEYGSWSRTFLSDSGRYFNDGNYWRIGADVNFLTKDPERNMFFLGMRYGRSAFSEKMSITTVDPVWGALFSEYANNNVKARWMELNSGLRVRMWKIIWMGYTARFKFWLKTNDTAEMLPHDVPGFGRTDRETYWGFNYYIYIRIPFRRTLTIPDFMK